MNGEVALTSDPEITWKPGAELMHTSLYIAGPEPWKYSLVGTGPDLRLLREITLGMTRNSWVLVSAKKRQKTFSHAGSGKAKSDADEGCVAKSQIF